MKLLSDARSGSKEIVVSHNPKDLTNDHWSRCGATPETRLLSAVCCLLLSVLVGCPAQRPVVKSKTPAQTRVDSNPSPDRVAAAEPPQVKSPPAGLLPTFQVVEREAGLDFERYEDFRRLHRILEVNGGGVAIFDFDLDQQLDLYFSNGCRLPLSLQDRSRFGKLFRADGADQYVDATQSGRLKRFGQAHGCAVGDFDADGFEDIYITGYRGNTFWRNQGDGTFADITASTGTQVDRWSSSAAFADLNGDGVLDLYVANYLDESDENPKLCPNPASPDHYEQCSPAKFDGVDDVLFVGDGSGGFVNGTAAAGMTGLKGKGLGVVIADLDGDFQPEIYVANDGQANFLFKAASTGTTESESPPDVRVPRFEDCALNANVALSESGFAQASMGIAAGDYDGNGLTDFFVTNFYADTNTLYANRGGLVFEDATRASHLASTHRQTLGWGTFFFDFDNNGTLDLFITNGHIDDRTWMKYPEPYKMRPLLYRNDDNREFVDVSAWAGDYFLTEWLGRGAARGDLNRDGKLDFAVSHQLAPSAALLNTTASSNRSISLKLVGRSVNRDGFGAVVETLETTVPQSRQLVSGDGFQSASAHEIHLGLRDQPVISVKIRWSAQVEEVHRNLTPGRWVVIEGCCALKTLDYDEPRDGR